MRDLRGQKVVIKDFAITASANADEGAQAAACDFAYTWNVPYVKRSGRAIQRLLADTGLHDLGVYEQAGRIRLYGQGFSEPFFYHPGVALLRVKQLLRGDADRLLEAARIRAGDRVLDATAGLCADTVVLSHGVAEQGRCLAVEANPLVAFVVAAALQGDQTGFAPFDSAMRRIDLRCGTWGEALRILPARTVDIVYFDPMFAGSQLDSPGIRPLRALAKEGGVSREDVEAARQIATRGVVVKDVRPGPLLRALDLEPIRRSGQSTWYSFAPSAWMAEAKDTQRIVKKEGGTYL
ncbi:MAG: class I SAM-dependent methyltransferase [Firmicutes bacterium]|nr:class I SAM-dependent methyltransferase [Bacillota bacterium]